MEPLQPYITYMQLPSHIIYPGARIAVVGSTLFPAPELVTAFIYSLPPGVVVVSGTDSEGLRAGRSERSCGGAVDCAAYRAAISAGLPFIGFPPEWQRFGRSAGHARNALIAACGLQGLVAFPTDPECLSPGTAGTVRLARRQLVPVFIHH
jgi:hypothetical protein